MLARRRYDARCRNPEYDRRRNPDVPRWLKCRAGEIVDSPDVAKLCLGEDPPLEPADEECRQAVLKLLSSPVRRGDMQRLKSMLAMRDKLSKQGREYVDAVFGRHQAEIAGRTPAQEMLDVDPASDEEIAGETDELMFDRDGAA